MASERVKRATCPAHGFHCDLISLRRRKVLMSLQLLTAGSGSKLIEDLEEVVEEVKKSPTDEGDLVALYGRSKSL